MKQQKQTQKLAYTGMFAALIFITTWAVHFPLGINGGYIHFGDSLIYLAACILPMPQAMLAGAIGAGLSDLMSPGGAVWILPTILIKPICCSAFTRSSKHILCCRNLLALFVAGMVNIVGYFFATAVIAGGFSVALAELPLSFVQPVGSAACFIAWGFALDRAQIRTYLPTALRERR